MSKVFLGDVAFEHKETCKGSKDNLPIVGLEHLTPEDVNLTMWSNDTQNSFTKMFRKGNVLFGRRRAYLKKAAVAPFDGVCSGDITVIEAIPEKILPELLPFVIQNDALFDYAVEKSAGSLSPRVKWEHLKKYSFELPVLEQQKKLVEILWAIDKTKHAYKNLIEKTDELVKSQFMEQFSTTEKVPLIQLTTIVMGQSPSSNSYNTVGEGVPFYQGSGEFTNKYVGEGMFCTAPTRMAQAGDILMSVRAPVGTVNITTKDCCIGRGLAAIRSNVSAEYNEYFLYAFRAMADELGSMGHGSTILAINKNELHNLMMPNATLSEQMKFIKFAQQSDKSKFELEQALAELTATYKRIISENLG